MTRCDECGRACHERSSAMPAASVRRAGSGGTGRPALTLVRGHGGREAAAELSELTRMPMPAGVRGALVKPVDGRLMATWMPLSGLSRIPAGRVLLSWTPTGAGRTDVTAHLGLARAQVLLAVWPGLPGDWTGVVRPTVAEVTELHAALRLATIVVNRLSD